MTSQPKVDWLQFFSGGVPTLVYFQIQVDELKELVEKSTKELGIDVTAELCMIGLAAYFEAFCKNQFAAVINIVPETLNRFTERRDCKITAKNLLPVMPELNHSLGFIIAEEYDFGSAKSVNGLFQDLLNITPFSKDEANEYGEFLNDRNLLVHHGGVYTAKYSGQTFAKKQLGGRQIYFDSLVVNKTDVSRWAAFLIDLATKMGKATSTSLSKFVATQKLRCDSERKKAIEALGIAN
jgi:hypothetical protein